MNNNVSNTRLSAHFMLSEFLNLVKHPDNIPTMQHVANLCYGCHMLLEPARQLVGPIIVNSGYRNEAYNRQVGGVANSQHLLAMAADIRPKDPAQFQRLVAGRAHQRLVFVLVLRQHIFRQMQDGFRRRPRSQENRQQLYIAQRRCAALQ